MNFNYNPNPMIVHSGLLKKGNDYSLFIWAEQKKHKKYVDIEPFKYPFLFSPFELKLALFRLHQPSFYGTFLETSECHIQVPLMNRQFISSVGNVPVYHVPHSYEKHLFPLEGIQISLKDLYLYLDCLLQLDHTEEWELADDFILIQQLLTAFLKEIKEGNFAPSINQAWELTNFPFKNWNEAAPLSLFSLLPANYSLLSHENDKPSLEEFGHEFLKSFFYHLLQSDQKIANTFQVIVDKQPTTIKQVMNAIGNAQNPIQTAISNQLLLESIGAIGATPFKLGIRLEEQTKSEQWLLTLFIQDRNDPSLMIDVEELLIGDHPWRENPITFFKEALKKGQKVIPEFQAFSLTQTSIPIAIDDAFTLLREKEDSLLQLGITVLVPSWWQKKENDFAVTLSQNETVVKTGAGQPLLNWQAIADFDYLISVGDTTISLAEFQQLVQFKRPIVKIKGKWVYWDVETASSIQAKIEAFKSKKKLTYLEALQLEQINDPTVCWKTRWNKKMTLLMEELSTHTWKKASIPSLLQGTLRPYQHDGFSWLMNMRKIGFGACLADDMGLGKTIQTITYILAIKELYQHRLPTPFLLICPTSLIGNWQQEITEFAPHLTIYVHHGQERLNDDLDFQHIDVIITSYALAVRDEDIWTKTKWEGLILDEAQHIKNIETKQRRSIKKMDAVHRIALTGTPIENRLKELWSIIDILNDHFLGTFQQFSTNFIKEIEGSEPNEEKLQELRKMISPFLLRRTKKDGNIQLQLPSKNEVIHRVSLTMEQASLYQAVINDLFERVDDITEMERRALILSSLTKLKQICNHPVHYLKDASKLEHRSGKWEKLLQLADTISSNGEKALIFTQYKEMGTIIQHGLEKEFKQEIPFLHGSLQRQKREHLIDKFMTDDHVPFFILSLKAGGVGLNLTKATHVIHYDRWWNPAVENQATDRAYRIGQTEDVTVHKLLTKGTLEEKIHLMLEKKQALTDNILNTTENRLSELSKEELEQFLSLRISTLS